MKNIETVLNLEDEVMSFIDIQSADQDIVEMEVITKFIDNMESNESIDVVLNNFGIHLFENFVEMLLNDGILDDDIPAKGKINLEKRKGIKYTLDHMRAIVREATGEPPW